MNVWNVLLNNLQTKKHLMHYHTHLRFVLSSSTLSHSCPLADTTTSGGAAPLLPIVLSHVSVAVILPCLVATSPGQLYDRVLQECHLRRLQMICLWSSKLSLLRFVHLCYCSCIVPFVSSPIYFVLGLLSFITTSSNSYFDNSPILPWTRLSIN